MSDSRDRREVRGARVYLRVSADEQDLARQEAIVANARASGYYVAAVYREKASGARADRPELLRICPWAPKFPQKWACKIPWFSGGGLLSVISRRVDRRGLSAGGVRAVWERLTD